MVERGIAAAYFSFAKQADQLGISPTAPSPAHALLFKYKLRWTAAVAAGLTTPHHVTGLILFSATQVLQRLNFTC